MNWNDNTQTAYQQGSAVTYDEGLKKYFISIYNLMGMGLLVTAATSWLVANTPLANLIFGSGLGMVFAFAPLAVIFLGFSNKAIMRDTPQRLKGKFYLLSALIGVSFSSMFLMYTAEDLTRVFLITAATFAGMSLYGYTTKRSLAGLSSFIMMGVWGVFIAFIVNIFLGSTQVMMIASMVGVLVYTLLIAYTTQNLKRMYDANLGVELQKMAVLGALTLYISFINLFQFLMMLLSNRN